MPKIFLVLGFVILALLYNYRFKIENFWLFNMKKAQIYKDNFFYESGEKMERKQPLALTKKEAMLKVYMGSPFRGFEQKDWDEFWNIIYGVFAKDQPEAEGLPQRVRQLNLEEIQEELISLYPQPFSYYKDSDWDRLFYFIFKK
ncbi:MAG: hypothetical protein KJ818_07605 [Candidatus Omnitrophica bacterium]|nr:hypothetical protein [Candidatus Omnitrophota bacterium]